MALFDGSILITDSSNKEDRDAVITNLLNHKSSRATLYILVKDFQEIESIKQQFPTVLPFVLIPGENIGRTRKMLKLLPHMDHFVNFLGQDLALEFLNRRSDFRIKSVSMAYARSSVIDKILLSNGQGIIFNINNSDNYCKDNVLAAGIAAKKSIKDFFGLAGQSSSSSSTTDEREPLLSKENRTVDSEPVNESGTANDSPSMLGNIWRLMVSLYYYLCPCVNDARVIIPVDQYPPDLDTKFMEAFEDLYKALNAEWFRKLMDERHSKERAIKQLQNAKEERVEKEYNRLMGVNSDLTATASNRFQAFVIVRSSIRLEKENIIQEYDRKTALLDLVHYQVVLDGQIETMISLWKKVRLTPS